MLITTNDYLSHDSLSKSELRNIDDVLDNEGLKNKFIAEKDIHGLIALNNRGGCWERERKFLRFQKKHVTESYFDVKLLIKTSEEFDWYFP